MSALNDIAEQVPPLLSDFLLTISLAFLIGLSLKEYYLGTHKLHTFGSTRTMTFIGMFGFVLFQLDKDDHWLYLTGMLVLAGFLSVYYHKKLSQENYGLIGVLTAMLTYLIGPVSATELLPTWFLILFVVSTLFILNARARIAVLRERMSPQEVITLAKFLLLAGVILPLLPEKPIADFIPVTPHQTWLAVVAVTAVSYASYLVQTYLFRGRGLLVTGVLGGLYSSTATTLVLAKASREQPHRESLIAASIVLASGMMYVRLLAIVVCFSPAFFRQLLVPFGVLTAIALLLALVVSRLPDGGAADAGPTGIEQPVNPLEVAPAFIFAGLYVATVAITHAVLTRFGDVGLTWMSLAVGFSDIAPFVLSVVQGEFAIQPQQIVRAIVLATASNNLLKAVYVVALGNRRAARLAGGVLLLLTAGPLVYAFSM